MRSTLQTQGSPASDVFLFHGVPSRIREFYVASTIPMRREIIESWDTAESLRDKIGPAQRVWIGTDWRWYEEFPIDWANEPEFGLISQIMAQDFVACGRFVDHPQMRLDLFARDEIFCLDSTPLLRFGEGITLQAISPLDQGGDTLRFDMAWTIAAAVPPDRYSVAVHIYDTATDLFVTAADYGLPAGPVGLAQVRLDLRDIQPGSYEIRVGIYDWRSGDRLPGADLQSGETGELIAIERFDLP
jgi:hypothetical protein